MAYDSHDQQGIKDDWDTYINKGKPLDPKKRTVRKIIYDSWIISKKNGVEPFKAKGGQISPAKLHIILKEKRELMDLAHPYMRKMFSFIKETNCIVALSDENGNVIDLVRSNGDITQKQAISKLQIGSNRSEKFAGTNGIGLCLRLDQPVQIIGAEHFLKLHHMYICSAAPIHDENGALIGCLDIIGPMGFMHEHTLGMVCSAVDGIEKGIAMKKALASLDATNRQIEAIIETINIGIILVNKKGHFLKYNTKALQLLHLTECDLQKETIYTLFCTEAFSIPLEDLWRDFSKKELYIRKQDNTELNLVLSGFKIANSYTDGSDDGTMLYSFEALSSVLKQVSKNSGFTAKYTFDSIIGKSRELTDAVQLAKSCASSMSNVLILGESGTGKELFAQAIHNASERAFGPFVAINCSSIPRTLIESELFGYEKGAFTGANREGSPGKFELANGGTIFLDEIGDMPVDLQTSLLRVIQNREIIRIGGKKPKSIDVRIISATNVNLLEKTKSGDFRVDLYYRLNVLSIHLTPLRQRPYDITLLAYHFINVYSSLMKKNISGIEQNALELLTHYDWPGNTRELENIIERAINLAEGNYITSHDLPNEVKFSHIIKEHLPSPLTPPNGLTLEEYEKNILLNELISQNGNINSISRTLGLSRRTLYRKFEKYDIDYNHYRK